MKALLSTAAVLALLPAVSFAANNSGIGGLATQVQGNFQALGNLVVAGGFLGGLALLPKTLMSIWSRWQSGSRDAMPWAGDITKLFVASALCMLPATTNTSVHTFYGSNAAETSPQFQHMTFE